MSKKSNFTAVTIILLVLLGIRILAQLFYMFINLNEGGFIFLLIAGVYTVPFIAILLKRKWGSITSMIISCLDILSLFFFWGGLNIGRIAGAVVADIMLVILSYLEFKSLK